MQFTTEEAYARLISHNMTVPQRIKVSNNGNNVFKYFIYSVVLMKQLLLNWQISYCNHWSVPINPQFTTLFWMPVKYLTFQQASILMFIHLGIPFIKYVFLEKNTTQLWLKILLFIVIAYIFRYLRTYNTLYTVFLINLLLNISVSF